MKECSIVRRGGGTKLFAAIGVTYPAGSTVTCTNGTSTLKAKTTTGQWVFAIPKAGTWTVTVTDGTNSKSRSVSITSEGQFESVELSYALVLIENGVEKQTFVKNNVNVSISDGLLAVSPVVDSYASRRFYYTEVDVTNYKSLRFSGYYYNYNNGYAYAPQIRAGVQIGTSYNQSAAEYIFPATTEDDYSIDVSELSGTYYVSIFAAGTNTETAGAKSVHAMIRNMRLE